MTQSPTDATDAAVAYDRVGLAAALYYAYPKRFPWDQARYDHQQLFLREADAAIEYLRTGELRDEVTS